MTHHAAIEESGYAVVRGLLSPADVERYRSAAQAVAQYARDGHWKQVRTRGKQFPPWPENYSPDIWGVSALLHPDLGDMASPFQEVYTSPQLLAVAADILQASESDLSMELLNMLVNPLTDFELDWHRDTIRPEATPEEEVRELARGQSAGTQFNLALTHDKCLIVVPGSHRRARTAEERANTCGRNKTGPLAGQLAVELAPGDAVFYDNNILHRAAYSARNERLTLHGSYGHKVYGHARAKGILQHGVREWLGRLEPVNAAMASMKAGLEAIAAQAPEDVGYALEG